MNIEALKQLAEVAAEEVEFEVPKFDTERPIPEKEMPPNGYDLDIPEFAYDEAETSSDQEADAAVSDDADGGAQPESESSETPSGTDIDDEADESGLSDEEKQKIKDETGWPDEIIDAILSMEEYKIYKDAGLQAAEINGRPCLINPNIDMDQKDVFGRTNRERMAQGLAPLDKSGKPIELHHIGQHADSPLAELTQEQHRGKDNYSILHDTKKDSEIDRPAFDGERSEHWKARSEGEENGNAN